MPSAQEIESKLAEITAQLEAGGTNAQMKKWYDEYKLLVKELKAAKAMQTTAPKTTCNGNPDDTQCKPSFKMFNIVDLAKIETG
jgi:hypothetical protein